MRAIVFTTLALAVGVRNAMNARAGCPIAGVDVGGGIHAPAALSATTRVSNVRKHPTLNRWAIFCHKPRLLLWWLAVKRAAQDRIDAGQAQAGDAAIVATTDEELTSAWDSAGEVA
jgi:hypothetical protein